MDFTEQLKSEILSGIPQENSCRLPFLAGVTKNCAYVELYKKSAILTYELTSKEETVAIFPLISARSGASIFFRNKGVQGGNATKI